MGVYTHSNGNWLSRRGGFMVALILFHIVLFWALKSGLAVKLLESITEPIKVDIVNEVKEEEPPPPPPPPKMELPPVEVPPPVIDITITADAPPTNAISNVTDKPQPPAPPPPPPPRQVVRTALKLNPKSTQPSVDDYYPETSRRLEEEGVAKIKVCVGTNGRVKTAETEETSGVQRLDEAGVKVAKLLRFTPPTVDGKPVDDACGTVPIRFQLPKR
ncbi:MAG: energy transducer TonB [Proteobacteria bacterium]|nr:energy transducer TonB [Pseudomonadota bacterium]